MTSEEMKMELDMVYNKLEKDNAKVKGIMGIKEIELKGKTNDPALYLSSLIMLGFKSSMWTFPLLVVYFIIYLLTDNVLAVAFGILAASSVGSIKKPILQDVYAFSVSVLFFLFMLFY